MLGIVAGFALVFTGIAMSGGSVITFYDIGSILIVLGGTMSSTLVRFKLDHALGVLRLLRVALHGRPTSPQDTILLLVRLAEKARREGFLAMEVDAEQLEDRFLQKGIHLVVDGTDPETVREIMEIELTFLEERHRSGQQIFEYMGVVSPAFGMVGTLIGLIIMLGSLDQPETVGPAMAVALITTFHGVLFANLVFNPIAGRLKSKTEDEVLLRELMIEGILSIQSGENPQIVKQKLESFLAPKSRRAMNAERPAEEVRAERMAATGAP